jgi:ribosomal protein S18 acetylase RimI-like enzyme
MTDTATGEIPHSDELDFSGGSGDDFEPLSRDVIPIRSLQRDDIDALVRIDSKLTGRDRRPYYERKVNEALDETGIRISLIAELDGHAVGFLMAHVDYGEFGVAEREAVIHSIGVDPSYARRRIGVALMSQLLTNLATLRVEKVVTEVAWDSREMTGLLNFLRQLGFMPSTRLSLARRV